GAALLFAVSPWAVLYSRKLWPQSLFPVAAVGLMHCVLTLRERPASRAIAGVPMLLSAMAQLQLSALALGIVIVALVAPRWRRVHARALAAGIAGALLLAAPYLLHLARGEESSMLSSPH